MSSDTGEHDELAQLDPNISLSSTSGVTRTVAIIKNHALAHRLDIEPRIMEAQLEIVKERQMEFDVDSDPETLIELFGVDDAESLGEGPVWVYVLERRRAVEVWNTLMGDPDPAVARENSPSSLRALYGLSLEQNGLMGSPDAQTAEIQIQALFASSPPFPTTDLPSDELVSPTDESQFNTLHSVSSSVMSALRRGDSQVTRGSSGTPSATGQVNANGRPGFKARTLPSTHSVPSIQPRTTKAAALRAGAIPDKAKTARYEFGHKPRETVTKEERIKQFMNVPGHKRAETIVVASTAAPTIAPRMTKAAALRLGIKEVEKTPPRGRPSSVIAPKRPALADQKNTEPKKNSFEGVPGHKRRESVPVASTAAPIVAPRTNRSAALRAQKEAAPPSSFMFKGATAVKSPGSLSRSSSVNSINRVSRPSSVASNAPRPSISRNPSTTSKASPSSVTSPSEEGAPRATFDGVPGHKRRESIAVASTAAPTVAPRTNKSAALRAAKKAEEAAAAAKQAAKYGGRPIRA